MSTAESNTRYSADDLLAMPDGHHFELVDGQLVEKPMGWEASYVATRIAAFISQFLAANNLGWCVAEGSYQCFADDPHQIRKPDVSFLSWQRMPEERPPAGHCTIAPDLAVEVISPTNTFSEIDRKVHEYLGVGVRVVWVVNPPSQTIHIYRPGESNVRLLHADDVLTGGDVLPGFECPVHELFATPAPQSRQT